MKNLNSMTTALTGKPGTYKVLFLFILLTGIIVRLINYFHNPGLWLDEASLSLNIIERSYSRLLMPLHRNQVAPFLFLWAERLSINLFGKNELALRLFPLVCSLLSMPLLFQVARQLFKDDRIALITLFIFAFAPLQVRYSAEVKQYMSDVFVFLLLVWLFLRYQEKRDRHALIFLWIGGIIGLFLSHISVFVLFVIGLYWIISDVLKRDWGYIKFLVPFTWLIAFGVLYFSFYSGHQNEQAMQTYWRNNFMPLNPATIEFWNFLSGRLGKIFANVLIFNKSGLGAGLFQLIILVFLAVYFLGIFMMIRERNSRAGIFLLAPVLLHLLLSGLKIYPFDTRLVLYLSPLVYMTLAYGLFQVSRSLSGVTGKYWFGALAIALILIIFPFKLLYHIPFEQDGTKRCIQYIDQNYKEGQLIYINQYSANIYKFYKKTGMVNWSGALIEGTLVGPSGGGKWDPYIDLALLNGIDGELWLLFGHMHYPFHPQYRTIMDEIRKKGKVVETFKSKVAAAHLVQLE